MTSDLEEQVQKLLAGMDEQNKQEPETGTPGNEPPEEIQDIYVLIVREHEDEEDTSQVVDSEPTPATTQVDGEPAIPKSPAPQPFAYVTLGIVLICTLPMLASIFLQVYLFLNPQIATVTIIPKSQTVSLTGTLQMGRFLQPITISQSQTTPTTGKGHQDARAAKGYITFYNGQFQSVTITAGLILTGSSGMHIITDQDATIPPGNPATGYGHTTVSAHAINPGSKGDIQAYDINEACCATSVLAVNLYSFRGGEDEQDFSTVSQQDINKVSTPLKISLAQSMSGALQGQLKPGEQLFILPCSPTVASDHQPGEEATTVKVTVSLTCSGIAYDTQALAAKATAYLATQAQQKTGAGYSLFGTVHVTVKLANVTNAPPPLVFLSFHAQGTWIYALSQTAQQQIKYLITGKTNQEAAQLLASLPGVEHAAIRFSGIGDTTRLPKVTGYIHIILFVL